MRADRLARLHAVVDDQAGEAVRVLPFTAGGYLAGGADPARPALDIRATVAEVPKTVRAVGSGSDTGHNAALRSATHSVRYATDALPFALARGDRVMLLERGGRTLTVNTADPFGTGRTIAHCEPLPAA